METLRWTNLLSTQPKESGKDIYVCVLFIPAVESHNLCFLKAPDSLDCERIVQF